MVQVESSVPWSEKSVSQDLQDEHDFGRKASFRRGRFSNRSQLAGAVPGVWQGRILQHGIIPLSIFITLDQQEDYLLSRKMLGLETCLSAVEVNDLITLLEFSLERLNHDGADLPVLIPTNAVGDLSLLYRNVGDDGNRLVIVSEIAERRPILVVLRKHTGGQNEQSDAGFEQ